MVVIAQFLIACPLVLFTASHRFLLVHSLAFYHHAIWAFSLVINQAACWVPRLPRDCVFLWPCQNMQNGSVKRLTFAPTADKASEDPDSQWMEERLMQSHFPVLCGAAFEESRIALLDCS